MKCPICRDKAHVEVDMHCDGFAEVLEECGHCGSVWTFENGKPYILHGPPENIPLVSIVS